MCQYEGLQGAYPISQLIENLTFCIVVVKLVLAGLQRRQEYTTEKRQVFSVSGAGNTGQLHVKG